MPRTLADLSREVEQEAQREGEEAVAELERFRTHYRLARQIAERREELQLSQQALAKLSGVHQSEISKIESGRANPTMATLLALLGPLGSALTIVTEPPVPVPAPPARARRSQTPRRTGRAPGRG